jgi:hypothetical protein
MLVFSQKALVSSQFLFPVSVRFIAQESIFVLGPQLLNRSSEERLLFGVDLMWFFSFLV